MAAKERLIVDVQGRKVELSSLEKILFPGSSITKAEVISYYTMIAPALLYHIKDRPLSLKRFPEGIEEESFFHKNRPKGAPDWIKSVRLGESSPKDYVLATDEASLAWLANIAAIELHIMNVRGPLFDSPDHLSFDIDPPEEWTFEQVVDLSFQLKAHLEGYGYHPFAKTSGKKGIHIAIPLERQYGVEECYEAAKKLAASFVKKYPETTTVSMKKEYRRKENKAFIDVVRNAPSQTTVAPYSLRGVEGAPVSAPVTWDELESLTEPASLNIDTVPERVQKQGDPWRSMYAFATPLHTSGRRAAVATPTSLDIYTRRRAFDRTPEPAPRAAPDAGSRFVVQRHHASRLHYDLRLEEEGVLRSWAVPKGLPPYPGVKRLAVATEDHPLEYLTFEGTIPQGQYGGGTMWVFASGRYEMLKRTQGSLRFRLHADGLSGEYRLYKTKGKDWLIERTDQPAADLLSREIELMAPESADAVPADRQEEFWCEVKWDGIRALFTIDEGAVRITTRNHLDITANFPELHLPDDFSCTSGAFDGEIICLDAEGRPDFETVVSRMHRKGKRAIEGGAKNSPAHCMLFDVLYLDGREVTSEPLWKRREWLEDSLRKRGRFDISETYDDCLGLWDTIEEYDLEGIIAKERNSAYQFGRTSSWLKIKRRHTEDFLIAGYTEGKGRRGHTIGALHLAEYVQGKYVYRGKVGTGLTDRDLRQLSEELEAAPELDVPIQGLPRVKDTTWISPRMVSEITYAERTSAGLLRKASFVRLRKDVTTSDYIENKTELPI